VIVLERDSLPDRPDTALARRRGGTSTLC